LPKEEKKMSVNATPHYVGQVERDRVGALWAILYRDELVISREQVRSLRAGRRRVADLVLSAADSFGNTPRRLSPSQLSGVAERSVPARRHRRSVVSAIPGVLRAASPPAHSRPAQPLATYETT
jgi:hypothetical protein